MHSKFKITYVCKFHPPSLINVEQQYTKITAITITFIIPTVKQITTTTTEEPTTGGLTGEIESHLIDSQFPFKKYTKETADLTGETIESALEERPSPSNNNKISYTNDARSSYYGLGGIHVPLSFSISGIYGRYGVGRPGLVASNYASAETSDSLMGLFGYGNNPKPALAGGGYNYNSMGAVTPRLRVYGSGGSGPSWSGWGNGKWGHYGKG